MIVFCPNVGSLDYLDLFHRPWDSSMVSAWKLYSHNLRETTPSGWGMNYRGALEAAGARRWLSQRALPRWVEHGVIKEHDLTGERLRDEALAIASEHEGVGLIDGFALDEPLIHTTPEIAADAITKLDESLSALNRRPVALRLIEAYPASTTEQILALIDLARPLLTGLDLDFDPWGAAHHKLPWSRVQADLTGLKDACHRRNLSFGMIVTGHHAEDWPTYKREAVQMLRWIPSLCQGWPDVLTVQSWMKTQDSYLLPRNLPDHLSLLTLVRETVAAKRWPRVPWWDRRWR